MSHAVRRIPVWTYVLDYSAHNQTVGTAYQITNASGAGSIGSIVTELSVFDGSGCVIDYQLGPSSPTTQFTTPPGGDRVQVILHPGMTLWINPRTGQGGTTITQGMLVITGYQ
jgi:hypothetical protein